MASKKTCGALIGLLLMVAVAVVLAGCGGGDSSSSSGGATTASGGNSSESSDSSGADIAAAEKILAPYIGHSSPAFPVDEPLKEKPSPDTTISSLEVASPIGAVIIELLEGAAKTAGVKLNVVKAGNTASTAQAAAETVVSQDPEAFILPPFEPSTISNQLKQMEENGTFVIGQGVIGVENYPAIKANLSPEGQLEEIGRIFAAWAVSKHGAKTDVVLFEHPERSFAGLMKEAFLEEMKELCPECKATTVPIPAEEASNAASRIVSELQANPEINQVLGISDLISGLPAAEKAAGISDVGTLVYPGEPQTLEYVKNGEIEGALAQGLGAQSWIAMDIALRAAQDQELTKGEKSGYQPLQILTQKDITFDPKLGWEPEANFMEKLAKYWHAEG